jgi:hypothetical protein
MLALCDAAQELVPYLGAKPLHEGATCGVEEVDAGLQAPAGRRGVGPRSGLAVARAGRARHRPTHRVMATRAQGASSRARARTHLSTSCAAAGVVNSLVIDFST